MSETVVFAGDSITEWGRGGDPRDLGTGYVGLLADGPLAGRPVRNAGVGGDTLADLADRWERDVLAHDPALVSIAVGINDTWRSVDSGRPSAVDGFRSTLEGLAAPLAAAGVELVLVEPFALPAGADRAAWAADLDPRRAAVRAVAARLGAVFVPLAEPFERAAARLGRAALAADGVHPTPAGHRLIADAWSGAYRASRPPAAS